MPALRNPNSCLPYVKFNITQIKKRGVDNFPSREAEVRGPLLAYRLMSRQIPLSKKTPRSYQFFDQPELFSLRGKKIKLAILV